MRWRPIVPATEDFMKEVFGGLGSGGAMVESARYVLSPIGVEHLVVEPIEGEQRCGRCGRRLYRLEDDNDPGFPVGPVYEFLWAEGQQRGITFYAELPDNRAAVPCEEISF